MKVELWSYNKNSPNYSMETELGLIASQSRKDEPRWEKDLFEKTLDWGHDSIQEFAYFVFHIEGISRVTLAQLTRHRMASFNVMSFRHVPPTDFCLPEGIKELDGEIHLTNNDKIKWYVRDGKFSYEYYCIPDNDEMDYVQWKRSDIKKCPVSLEDIRYGFPMGLTTNLFMGINGRSLRNFLKLRLDSHAQWEIRELTGKIYDLVKDVFPMLLKGLEK